MMEMLFEILPAILIPLAISIILPWIYGQSKKEEAENKINDINSTAITVTAPKIKSATYFLPPVNKSSGIQLVRQCNWSLTINVSLGSST